MGEVAPSPSSGVSGCSDSVGSSLMSSTSLVPDQQFYFVVGSITEHVKSTIRWNAVELGSPQFAQAVDLPPHINRVAANIGYSIGQSGNLF